MGPFIARSFRGSRASEKSKRPLALVFIVLAAVLGGASPALGQSGEGPSSAVDARAAADSARRATAEAQRELEEARSSLEEAEARVVQKAQEAEQLEATAAEAAAAEAKALEEEPLRAAQEAVRRAADAERRAAEAERKASRAERKAQEALRLAEELESRFAYDRTGLFVGAGAFYAPEAFDEGSGVVVTSSRGAMARIGYRFHSRFAADIRVDWLEEFELRSAIAEGELDGYAITGNLRLFLLTNRFQPWLSLGAGAIRTDFDARFLDGGKLETGGVKTDPITRFGGGFDFYLTSSLAVTVEAAFNIVSGDRDWINYGQLGAGLDFRF